MQQSHAGVRRNREVAMVIAEMHRPTCDHISAVSALTLPDSTSRLWTLPADIRRYCIMIYFPDIRMNHAVIKRQARAMYRDLTAGISTASEIYTLDTTGFRSRFPQVAAVHIIDCKYTSDYLVLADGRHIYVYNRAGTYIRRITHDGGIRVLSYIGNNRFFIHSNYTDDSCIINVATGEEMAVALVPLCILPCGLQVVKVGGCYKIVAGESRAVYITDLRACMDDYGNTFDATIHTMLSPWCVAVARFSLI